MHHSIVNFIESLSKSEKRYIHLQLKAFSGKDNINLNDFELLEKSCHKNNIKAKTKGNLTRLYYRLLDILADYHSNNLNTNNIDYVNLNRAKLLYNKGFYEEAEKLINKILNSPSGNNHLIKVEAIELRLINAVNTGEITYLSSQFDEDKARLRTISEEYTNLINYQILWAASKYETSSGYFFDNKSNFSDKQYQDYLSSEANAISPMAKILYNKLKGYASIKSQNIDDAFNYSERAVEIFHQNPGLIASGTVEYLKSIRNYTITLNFKNESELAYEYICSIEKKMEKPVLNKNTAIKTEAYILFVMMKMDLMINGQRMHEHTPEFEAFEKSYQEMRDLLPQDEALTSSYHFVIFYLHSPTPRKALKYINYILKNVGTARRDIHRLALIAELVTHFRLANIDLLESKLNSYKKFLNKHPVIFGFENEIPTFFSKILSEPENTSLYKNFINKVRKNLTDEKKDIYQHYNPLQYLKN